MSSMCENTHTDDDGVRIALNISSERESKSTKSIDKSLVPSWIQESKIFYFGSQKNTDNYIEMESMLFSLRD